MRVRVYKVDNFTIGIRYDDEPKVALMSAGWEKQKNFPDLAQLGRAMYLFEDMSEEELSDLKVVLTLDV